MNDVLSNSAASRRQPWVRFGVFAAVLCLCFVVPLSKFLLFVLKSELYSHVLLIPAISAYLVRLRRERIPAQAAPAFGAAGIWALMGVASLGACVWLRAQGVYLSRDDYFSLTIFSFVSFLMGGSLVTLGGARVRALAFPLAFLFFMVPFPAAVMGWIESFFQHGSAEVCDWMLQLVGASVLRDGQVFRLPGITIEVASECSGIRSSLMLFITCLLAGHLFLRTGWMRGALALAVIPLGILRNAFRVFTLAMLCVHVDRDVIDSPLHRQGGPVFFVLSLVPLFFLLWLMRKAEARQPEAAAPEQKNSDIAA